MASDVFHVESRVILQPVAPFWMNRFHLCYQDGERNRQRVVLLWFHPVRQRNIVGRETATDPGGGVCHPDQ